MNTRKLIKAAKEIDRLVKLQNDRTQEWQTLAILAKNNPDMHLELLQKKRELELKPRITIDNAIRELCSALNAKPDYKTDKLTVEDNNG